VKLRVASFNVRFGMATDGWNSWPFRRRAAGTVARHLEADVLGLQEAYQFQARSIRRRLGRYGMTGDGRSAKRKGEHCTVLYRRSVLRLTDSSTRWYGDEPFTPGTMLPDASHPRIVTIVDLEPVGGGPGITVANTHFDQRHDDNRVASARQLAGWLDVAERPTIVVGDLNAGPASDALRVLTDAGLRSAVPDDAPGTNHDYGKHVPKRRIDHILVSPHWTVHGAEVVTEKPHGRYPSDHWPLYADLELPD
jgi:endonuclease/exonuclease/phosphatase family metal-dependent hydrolase